METSKAIERTKYGLDWLQHGDLLVRILGGLGAGTLVRAALLYFTRLNPLWITPLWLFSAAGAIALTVYLGNKRRVRSSVQPSTTQGPSTGLFVPPFDAKQFFATAYRSALEDELKQNVRTAAHVNSPKDHEDFYVNLITVGLPAMIYDVIWAYIFRSQLLALMELNRKIMLPDNAIKVYYDKAAADTPEPYAHYSFQQWIEFLRAQSLIICHPSKMIELTHRGRDFLKYLTHCGRYPEQRKF